MQGDERQRSDDVQTTVLDGALECASELLEVRTRRPTQRMPPIQDRRDGLAKIDDDGKQFVAEMDDTRTGRGFGH